MSSESRGVPTYSLPEGEEDDQLDAQHLQEWLVLRQVVLELDVELNDHEHSHRH